MTTPRLFPLAYAGFTLWTLGYPDQGLAHIQELLTFVEGLADLATRARILHWATTFFLLRREWTVAQAQAETALTLAVKHGLGQWVGVLTFQRGQALAVQGQYTEGLALMQQAMPWRAAAGWSREGGASRSRRGPGRVVSRGPPRGTEDGGPPGTDRVKQTSRMHRTSRRRYTITTGG